MTRVVATSVHARSGEPEQRCSPSPGSSTNGAARATSPTSSSRCATSSSCSAASGAVEAASELLGALQRGGATLERTAGEHAVARWVARGGGHNLRGATNTALAAIATLMHAEPTEQNANQADEQARVRAGGPDSSRRPRRPRAPLRTGQRRHSCSPPTHSPSPAARRLPLPRPQTATRQHSPAKASSSTTSCHPQCVPHHSRGRPWRFVIVVPDGRHTHVLARARGARATPVGAPVPRCALGPSAVSGH